MNITDEEIHQLIISEFKAKTLGVTKQYLEIHEAVQESGNLKIERIDREKDIIVAYLPVKDECFYLAIYIDPQQNEIFNIGTESRNLVSLIATSETLTSKELISFTNLYPTETWDKGDLKSNRRAVYTFSGIEFLINPEPDEFEDKLEKLLSFLKNDAEGIIRLAKNANVYVRVIMDFHGGNQLLGGVSVNAQSVKNLSELNLSINFEFGAWGNPFR